MRNRFLQFIATGFGAGRVPAAPGLAGSVVGVGWWWLLAQTGNVWIQWFLLGVGFVFAVWCAGQAAAAMCQKDPSCVVIDEIAAVPLALAGLTGWWLVLAFGLFRLFDVWKPGPIRWSQQWPNGWGIVADDLLAATATCGVTHAIVWAVGVRG